jgi:hypothetical protein
MADQPSSKVTRKEALEAVDDIRMVIKMFIETLSDAGKVDRDIKYMLKYADEHTDELEKVSLSVYWPIGRPLIIQAAKML